MQTDPVKGASPWKRGVIGGEQILVCPECQDENPAWKQEVDKCPRCGSARLAIVMGSILCKDCNHDWAKP
ncbi:MAG TPA: hypothetical protein VE174_10850 [Actinomycetota bacterium]|nr:hypothetical protein [Actinomycetota bacterium]